MIIQFGRNDKHDTLWYDNNNVFVSQPFFKIVADNGAGIYILNSFKFYFFPRFYFKYSASFIETGINFAGWIFEFMWNKSWSKE